MKALQGYDTIDRVYRAEAQKIGSVQIRARDLSTLSEGPVDWVSAKVKLYQPDRREIPHRVTTILHKDDKDWKPVQHHTSVGIPNSELTGKEPTVRLAAGPTRRHVQRKYPRSLCVREGRW